MRRITAIICALLVLGTSNSQAQTPTEIPVGKKFYIQSAINHGRNNGGYWDVPGKPATIQRGSNIQVWDLDDGHDRIFRIHQSPEKGYYELQVGNTAIARVDIAGGKRDDQTNVQVWDRNGQEPQRFLFQHQGNGRFKIFYRNRKVLCLAGRSSANGTNVHLWGDHDGAWMEWYLIDVDTKKPFIPKSYSKTPDFFIKNKYFKFTSGGMVFRAEGAAVVEKVEGNKISVRIVGINYNSDVPPGTPTEIAFDYVMEATYENGKYIHQFDYYAPTEVSDDEKSLSFYGDDAGFTFSVDPQAKKLFDERLTTPHFFIYNKFFKYESEGMNSRSEGTAKVEKIEGNLVFVRLEGKTKLFDVPPGQPTEVVLNHVQQIVMENGKYILNPEIFTPGEICRDHKTLTFSGEAHASYTVSTEPRRGER
jgi:hypothetical protein